MESVETLQVIPPFPYQSIRRGVMTPELAKGSVLSEVTNEFERPLVASILVEMVEETLRAFHKLFDDRGCRGMGIRASSIPYAGR